MIPMTNIRGYHAHNEALAYIGARVRWPESPPGGLGTITRITTTTNGYIRFHVEWDEDCPDWWGRDVSPGSQIELVNAARMQPVTGTMTS